MPEPTQINTPRIQLAIVSPCSTCKNARAKIDEDGRSPCPRAAWIARRDEKEFPTPIRNQELFSGGEMPPSWLFAPRDINPVHLENLNRQVLMWVATVASNGMGVLDPSFNTENIICEGLPYVPDTTMKQYYHHGELKGHQPVMLTEFPDLRRWDDVAGIYIGGFARPVDFPSSFLKVQVPLDFGIPGA